MNNLWENNKKKITIAGVLLLIAILISIANSFVQNKTISAEAAIKELATLYYEELYHPHMTQNYPDLYEDVLEIKSEEGIKVTLLDLLVKIENASLEPFANDKKSYDLYTSYVIIYPNSPYDAKDYKIEFNLEEATYESGDDNE